MKAPIALIRSDTGVATFWCCAECGTFCGDQEDYAKYHCGGRPCDLCGQLCEKHKTRCPECIASERAKKDAERIAKAEKIKAEDYDGPVYWDERDTYYSDVGEAWEAICDDFYETVDLAKDQTLWACDVTQLTLHPNEILEAAIEGQEHHEDAMDHISQNAWDELRAFCENWNVEHGSAVKSWFPNKKLVVIPDEWHKKFIEEVMAEQEK